MKKLITYLKPYWYIAIFSPIFMECLDLIFQHLRVNLLLNLWLHPLTVHGDLRLFVNINPSFP